MKRILLAALCALALLLAGCADVNQTNTFADLPAPEATGMPTAAPEITPPPVVQLDVQPTPALTIVPATDTPQPEGGPGGPGFIG